MPVSPAFVCSVPKSGTHLILGILRSILGDDQVYEHTDEKGEHQILTEKDVLAMPRFDKKIYVGHFAYSDKFSNHIKDFKKILLIRDPRNYVISMAYYMNFSTNYYYRRLQTWEDKIASIILGIRRDLFSVDYTFTNYFLNWAVKIPSSMIVRFEDIVDKQFGGDEDRMLHTMRSILQFLSCTLDFKDESLMEKIKEGSKPEKSFTFRKSKNKVGNWRTEFTARNVMQLKRAAPQLVPILGYEKDENWNNNSTMQDYRTQYPRSYEYNSEILNRRMNNFPVIERYYELLKINSYLAYSDSFISYSPCTKEQLELINDWALRELVDGQDYIRCLPILDILLSIRPEDPEWNYFKGFCLMQLPSVNEELLRAALGHFDIALKNGYSEFWTLCFRGQLFYKLDELRHSVRDLRRAISLDPNHGGAKSLLHLVESSLDSEEHSQETFNTTDTDTFAKQIQKIRGIINQLDFETAIEHLHESLRKAPSHAELNYLYAFCLHQQIKNARKALPYYDTSLKNGFDEFMVRRNRASLFIYLGEFDAARVDITRALELNSTAKDSLAALSENLILKELLAKSQVKH